MEHVINILVTNGLSHPSHLDESSFISRGIKSIFSFLFCFSLKFMSAYRLTRHHIRGYYVCLCPIKRTPGLHGLRNKCLNNLKVVIHQNRMLIVIWGTLQSWSSGIMPSKLKAGIFLPIMNTSRNQLLTYFLYV